MATLLDFAKWCKDLPASLQNEASRCAVEVAQAVQGDLAYTTPVDTSQALSNWQISLGSNKAEWILPYYTGRKGSTQLASAKASVEVAKYELEKKKPGETIFIANMVDYIEKLNDGSSTQQPAGFVERSMLKGQKVIDKFVVNVRF